MFYIFIESSMAVVYHIQQNMLIAKININLWRIKRTFLLIWEKVINKSEKSNGERQKHRPGVVKFSIPMANDTLVSFSHL